MRTPEVLPLVVRGADRREALDVLGRAQARADRLAQVGDRGVALQVEVVLVPARAVLRLDREGPERRPALARGRGGHVAVGPGGEAGGLGGRRAGAAPSARPAAASRVPSRRPRRPSARARLGDERGAVVVQRNVPWACAPQLERRVPAAGDQQQVARDGAHGAVRRRGSARPSAPRRPPCRTRRAPSRASATAAIAASRPRSSTRRGLVPAVVGGEDHGASCRARRA